jgi:hypothetical protein
MKSQQLRKDSSSGLPVREGWIRGHQQPGRASGMRAKPACRIRKMTLLALLSAIAASSLLLGCSGNPLFAGGVETTNGLTVVSSGLTVRGSAPVGSTVYLFSKSYSPLAPSNEMKGFGDSISLDSGITFSFTTIRDSGSYNILARNTPADSGALISALHVRSGGHDSLVAAFDRLGKIRGTVSRIVSGGNTVAAKDQGIYCEGSNLTARSDSLGSYTIDKVPVGRFFVRLMRLQITVSGQNEQPVTLSRDTASVIVNFVIQ